MICDIHSHTKEFSLDSAMEFSSLIDFLKANPDKCVCTTEHFDYDYTLHIPYEALKVDIDEYSLVFNSLKSKYENQFDGNFPVLFGIEFGHLSHLGDFYKYICELRHFDCVIGSVHCIGDKDPYWDKSIYSKGKTSVYSMYLELIVEMLETSDSFDVVGHFDYVSRYAPFDDKLMRYSDFADYFDIIFRLCIEKGKSIELNTRTYTKLRKENFNLFFDENIIKRYKELGGELISFGSDSHDRSELFNLFEETREMLINCGFKHMVYFKDRKPVFFKI